MATEAVMNVFVPLTLPNGNTDKKPIMAQPVSFTGQEIEVIERAMQLTRNMFTGNAAPVHKEAQFKISCVLGAMARWERENG